MKLALQKRQERAEIVKKAQLFNDAIVRENRAYTTDEQVQFDAMMDHADKIRGEVDELEKLDAQQEARAHKLAGLERELRTPIHEIGHRAQASGNPPDARAAARLAEFRGVLRGERPETKVEFRAHQVDNPAAGGYLVKPEQWHGELIKAVDNLTFMRQICRTFTLADATAMSAPSRDTRMNDADWTQELTSATNDTALTLGKRLIKPHPLSKLVKISNPLLRLSQLPAEQLLRDELSYTFGITMEQAFLTGTGAGRPLGIFIASSDGVPTSRDVSTDNTTTAVTADGLFNAFYSLKVQYQARAVTVGHRDLAKMVRKLKYGSGEYIWAPGLNSNQPDSLFNRPFFQSEYAPSTFTSGLYVACIFDPAAYWIVDSMNLDVQVLRELYAATNETGFIGRAECDGQPVISEAFARVKLG